MKTIDKNMIIVALSSNSTVYIENYMNNAYANRGKNHDFNADYPHNMEAEFIIDNIW